MRVYYLANYNPFLIVFYLSKNSIDVFDNLSGVFN